MRMKISGAPLMTSLAALLALGVLAGITPAAANDAADKIISNYCDNNPGVQDCNDWRYNRAGWSTDQYLKFYNQYRSDPAFQSAEAEAAFGLPVNSAASTQDVNPGTAPVKDPLGTADIAVPVSPSSGTPGASAGGEAGAVLSTPTGNVVKTVPEVIGDSPTHVSDCMATYKSYDPATDTYMGFSGERQKCKL
ncbi:BA14K family protein [Dongia sedimenti]|uniref:Lectin-like protein BA14k n=1 Tax=Dongia sedimenti TaxID=3064282 RepID=A0ABU0YUR1_9PROT|nr:BA14K family protein [Rhodospirillaceae bacterium R-7]